jgi:polyvinyl alcohol dehydrogenase (cytochrome)
MPNRSSRAVALFSLLTLLASGAQAARTLCQDRIDVRSPVVTSGFGFNESNTRNQPSAIRADNVSQLSLHHTHVADGSKEKRSVPAVTEQTIYYAENADIVAANRASGCEYWRYKGAVKNKPLLGINNIRSSSILYVPPAVPYPAMVLAGDFRGNFYAVNAQSGQEVWQGFMGTEPSYHMITGSAQIHKGTLFVPVATNEVVSTVVALFSPCCNTHGLLRALDVHTGRVKWTYHTAPDPKDNGLGGKGPSGMSLWGTPVIDEADNAVLIGSGQNLSLPATDNSDAIISLDMDSGKVKWVFQSTKGDAWNAACQAPEWLASHCPNAPNGQDFDFGAPPVLAGLPNGGKAILAAAKNGVVYSLNPKTGALNWSTRLGVGGSLGGIHWGLAVDATKVYAGVTDIWVNKLSRLAVGDLLTGGLLANMAPVPGARPGIYALDLLSGRVVWEKHIQHNKDGQTYNSLFSAALTVTNDVLLAGSLDGKLRALRTSDGQELWSFDTAVDVVDVQGVAGHGGSIDSAGPVPAGRDLYVNSGYSTFGGANPWQGGNGNALFVFRLP